MHLKVNEKLKNHYDNYYGNDGKENEWRKIGAIDKVQNIINTSEKYPHKKILEIGSGEGAILERLSKFNFGDEFYSLEISKSGIESILKKNIPRLKEAKFYDGYNIPYKDKEFDIVILSHVLEHVEHPRQLLYEAGRVGEVVFIEVPLEDTIRLEEDYLNNNVGHINFYSNKTIKMLVSSCDYKILKYSITNSSYLVWKYSNGKIGIFYYILTELGLKISPTIASKFLPYHCALICKKNPTITL